ncbi:DUF2975 domain-containing protein [Sphingopyxis sp. H115]|uniref:DUF2975 domain-containing protein n=1 Tax=Sphingopyxis sp. H115 TaxID=1759073 RepID=UPI000736DFC8|nr:DUF2975 domain-containing protein [Sphingopyxis sp. H115]KTE17112.1 hypothetical protein ATE71_03790 [Sphingopyxis sp. H115]
MLQWSRRLLAGLNILNWVAGLLILATFAFVAFAAPDMLAAALDGKMKHPEAAVTWLQWVLVITAPVILLAHVILTRLIAMIDDARAGNPFASANAARLRHVAWALLGIQLLDLAFGFVSIAASERTGEYFGWSFGLTGWLATLMLFILARIFERGAAMREELEQTI